MALRFSKEHHKEYYEIANQKLFNNAYEYEQFKTLEQAIKFLIPEEIKTEMETDGPLFQYCKQVVDFYYNQGKIKTKPEPASFIDNKLYIQALDSYLEKEK
jgi:hypothetical protein